MALWMLEVNASPGFGIEKITRRNVAGKIIEYIERNAKRGNKKIKSALKHKLVIIGLWTNLVARQ